MQLNLKKISLPAISLNRFTLIVAAFYVAVFHIPFFSIVKQGIEKQAEVDPIFIATIPLFLLFALSFIFSLFSIKYLVKPFFILLTLASSSVFFAALKYGVVFDYGMIENTMQTHSAEALTYLNGSSVINFVLTGLLPSWLIYKANIEYKPFARELLHKVGFMLSMLAGIGVIAALYFQNYVAFGRNNDEMKRYIIPTYYIGAVIKYVHINYLQEPIEYKKLGQDAVSLNQGKQGKPNLTVLVVGETARAKNYQQYGYHKPTNAHTQNLDLTIVKDMTSCGTATAVSLPCMFSRMDRDSYESRQARAQDTVVDVLNYAGVKVTWLDNDSGCKGVCDRVENLTIDLSSDPELCSGQYCYDQVLLKALDKKLNTIAPNQDTLIVLHVIGSHGPTYYLRYPPEHRKFVPDCQRSDIQNCTQEELINTYDNTILYTDYIVAEVVKRLKSEEKRFNTAMIYLSDHGESLGENGMYLHGAPYSIAPKEQIEIPMTMWFSQSFININGIGLNCLKEQTRLNAYSHDNLFDSLLGLFNIKTSVYRPELDMFSKCRN